LKMFGDRVQPRTIVTLYPAESVAGELSNRKATEAARLPVRQQLPPAAAAMSTTALLTGGR
ncbi:MAG: hypothetical protein MUP13_09435, partial [Thermoanaerobaculales bacterium]|nr:hypothetical protein [Thermoanaerobaculales bacterium]